MKLRVILIWFILSIFGFFTIIALADYKVVIKKNQKTFEGDFIREDETSITIKSQGTLLTFKKDALDLDRMKELNPQTQTAPVPEQKLEEQPEVSLSEMGKKNRESQKGTGKTFSDTDRVSAWKVHRNDPDVQKILKEIDEKETEIAALEKGRNALAAQEKITDLRGEVEKLKDQLESYRSLEEALPSASAHQEDPAYWQGQVDQLESELADLQKQLLAGPDDTEREELLSEAQSVEASLAEAQQRLAELTAKPK